jgi:primosomal protein N'
MCFKTAFGMFRRSEYPLLTSSSCSFCKELAFVKCPVCSGKLDIDMKQKSAKCHTCGWRKILGK